MKKHSTLLPTGSAPEYCTINIKCFFYCYTGADFCIALEPTDTLGKLLDMDAYKEYIKPYAGNISTKAFDLFLNHLSASAKEYRAASLRQALQ